MNLPKAIFRSLRSTKPMRQGLSSDATTGNPLWLVVRNNSSGRRPHIIIIIISTIIKPKGVCKSGESHARLTNALNSITVLSKTYKSAFTSARLHCILRHCRMFKLLFCVQKRVTIEVYMCIVYTFFSESIGHPFRCHNGRHQRDDIVNRAGQLEHNHDKRYCGPDIQRLASPQLQRWLHITQLFN